MQLLLKLSAQDGAGLLESMWDFACPLSVRECILSSRAVVLSFSQLREKLWNAHSMQARLTSDGSPFAVTRGPFLQITPEAHIEQGLALPSVTLDARCQTVRLVMSRQREFFSPSYDEMRDRAHTPSMKIEIILNGRDGTRLEANRRAVSQGMQELSRIPGLVLF